jgi:hypothetical protein
VALVKLEYSTNGGANYLNTIANSVDASLLTYAWTIPDAIGTQLRVKITDTSDSTVYSASAANFSIKGALSVTSPNGGENWIVSTAHNVAWTRTGAIANVKIDYSKNSGVSFPLPITASTDASTGSFAWTIPDDLSILVRVRMPLIVRFLTHPMPISLSVVLWRSILPTAARSGMSGKPGRSRGPEAEVSRR